MRFSDGPSKMVTVAEIKALPGVPQTAMGGRKWLLRLAVPVTTVGQTFTFALSDLPAPVRLAYITRQIEAAGLPVGTYDEAAHDALADTEDAGRGRTEGSDFAASGVCRGGFDLAAEGDVGTGMLWRRWHFG